MTSYVTENTARYVCAYTSNGKRHELMLRYASTFLALALGPQTAGGLFTSLDLFLPSDFALLDAKVYALGAVTSGPALNPVLQGAIFPNLPYKDDAPNFISFVGKSAAGQLVNYKIFGVISSPQDVIGKNYRYEEGESQLLTDAITLLRGDGNLVATDRNTVTISGYANYAVHAGMQRKARRG